MERVEVITGVQRRRRFSAQEKAILVAECEQPGMSVSLVARRHGISASLLFRWKKLMKDGGMSAIESGDEVVSAAELKALNKRVRVAFSLDCCDRELMRYVATTGGITAEMVQDLLLESLEYRFGQSERVPHPLEWLTDNGSCYIARETRAFAASLGFIVCTTPVRSPQSNGMAEAFVKTFKRDYVYLNDLPDAATVMAKLPEWIEDYNATHPHKGLKMKSPWEYRAELALAK